MHLAGFVVLPLLRASVSLPLSYPRDLKPRATRWICIGSVKQNHFVCVGGAGYPGGFWLNWRGRVSWCQPNEFLTWEGLMAAIRHRLGLAGLEMVAISSSLPRTDYTRLHVLVRIQTDERRFVSSEADSVPAMRGCGEELGAALQHPARADGHASWA